MPRPEPKVCCKHCGSERIEVEFEATGTGDPVFGVSNGEVYVEFVENPSIDDIQSHERFRCEDCHKSAWKAKDLVQATPAGPEHLQPGDVVFLPDSFKGVVATVDYEAYTFTVEGWHETFEFHEALVIDPAEMIARAA